MPHVCPHRPCMPIWIHAPILLTRAYLEAARKLLIHFDQGLAFLPFIPFIQQALPTFHVGARWRPGGKAQGANAPLAVNAATNKIIFHTCAALLQPITQPLVTCVLRCRPCNPAASCSFSKRIQRHCMRVEWLKGWPPCVASLQQEVASRSTRRPDSSGFRLKAQQNAFRFNFYSAALISCVSVRWPLAFRMRMRIWQSSPRQSTGDRPTFFAHCLR